MALLKFFEGKESSYSSSSHSGGLYFAKDTGVILFNGVKYGSKPGITNYATKYDITSLWSELRNKSDSNHKHVIDDISDLIIASKDNDGLMPSYMYNKLNELEMVKRFDLGYIPGSNYVIIYGDLLSEESGNQKPLPHCQPSFRLLAANPTTAGLMSADDKKKLDSLDNTLKKLNSLANTLQALSVQPLNNSSEISPASLIGSDRYDILKGITDKYIGVNAQFTDGKLTIGLYDFNNSEWVGAPSVTIPLQ